MKDHKTCSKCAASKPVSAFAFKDVAKTKYRSSCRLCATAGIKNRKMTPEVAEALKVKERARNHARSAYIRAWALAHKEQMQATARIRQANKPKPLPIVKPAPTSCAVYFLLCQQTGTLFTAKADTAKYCREARRLRQLVCSREREVREHDKRQLTYTCKQCEHPFTPAYGTGKRAFCSDACTKAAVGKAKRDAGGNNITRARFYGVAYEAVKVSAVMGRAGWHCQACGIATPVAKRGSYDDDAPEVGHIIPMSKSGAHLYSNVQCLCRRCNLTKANTMPKSYIGVPGHKVLAVRR